MSAKPKHSVTLRISGIVSDRSKSRFAFFLAQGRTLEEVHDKNPNVALHLKTATVDKSPADIIIYANGTITLSSRPSASDASFEDLRKDVERLAEMSAKAPLHSLAVSRAVELIDFVNGLDTLIESKRMAAVILSDTAIEIMLREKLRSHQVEGTALDEGIPDKIKRIEKKGELVYRANEIMSVRKLRNDVVHKGSIPSKKESEHVIEISADFAEKA